MTEPLKKNPAQNIPLVAPSVLKARATDPSKNVWVGASAGSGKTTVLTERLIRLLLPNEDRAGADPAKIICITFTKAAASEVLERVMRYLRHWSIEPEEKLKESLEKILNAPPTQKQCDAARALFARILEVPGGMKILTIHAFCQSVLARFPMEAGLPAGFEVMEEEETRTLLTTIRHRLIERLETESGQSHLKTAFEYLSANKTVEDLEKLLSAMMGERGRLSGLLEAYKTVDALCAAVYCELNADEGKTDRDLVSGFLKYLPEGKLKQAIPQLQFDKGKNNQKYADFFADFLASPPERRVEKFGEYHSTFVTGDLTPRKLSGTAKDNESLCDLFETEAARLITLWGERRNLETARATASLLRFSLAILGAYDHEKKQRNRLDFEDLIHKTKQLLGQGGVHWVQYKLDGGIDHILVDEAQDTNPDQWDIVNALSDEFYDGTSTREKQDRTTFIVGDEKQSIFSFQRADPRVFDTIRTRLEKRVREAQLRFDDVPMQTSFRSAPSILGVVDAVFKESEMWNGVSRGERGIAHIPHLTGKAGYVEIWPAIVREKTETPEIWELPTLTPADDNPVALLASRIASCIRDLLDNPAQILESKGRRIEPGDIMVLLAKRKPFADAVLKALRRENIPVSGMDRMVVTKQLAVMDTLAVAAFALQPYDDLNLATLLKTPFIGWDDDALYTICHGRSGTLWTALRDTPQNAVLVSWLENLQKLGAVAGASAFFHTVLYAPCPADARSGMRALMARLGTDITDPMQEFLRKADAYDMRDVRGLQGFYEETKNDNSEIKRQMHESGGCVRLMTVHGSKGLEAPIVFLPDTIRTTQSASKTNHVLWPEREETSAFPLWAPSSEWRADALIRRISTARLRADEEYRRLLYVALTRAADRLYIGGADNTKKGADRTKSWYDRIHAAFTNGTLEGVEEKPDGSLVVRNRQTDPVKADDRKTARNTDTLTRPYWMDTPAPAPELPPRPLTPSKPAVDEPAALSPLFGDTSWRYARGRIIHTLFQFLPDLPPEIRREKAYAWLSQPAHNLDENARAEILKSVMDVLEHKEFGEIFSQNARAEVPLTGLLGKDKIVSGQIDRLVVTPEKILVLDYKTNRPAPRSIQAVPEAYRQQMQTYRAVLGQIWPERAVRCALLWTDGPNLMDITDILES